MEEGKHYHVNGWRMNKRGQKGLLFTITPEGLDLYNLQHTDHLGPRPNGILAMIGEGGVGLRGEPSKLVDEEEILSNCLVPFTKGGYWCPWILPLFQKLETLLEKHPDGPPTATKTKTKGECTCPKEIWLNHGCKCGAITPYQQRASW